MEAPSPVQKWLTTRIPVKVLMVVVATVLKELTAAVILQTAVLAVLTVVVTGAVRAVVELWQHCSRDHEIEVIRYS